MSEIKVSDPFKTVIEQHLSRRAENDPLFAVSYAKPNKNVADCVSYILNTVKKSGISGFTDDEVFGMAAHYYDEDDIQPGEPMSCKVVVNHTVQLTEEEIKAAKKQAHDEVVNAEIARLRSSKAAPKKTEENTNLLFEF